VSERERERALFCLTLIDLTNKQHMSRFMAQSNGETVRHPDECACQNCMPGKSTPLLLAFICAV